MLANRVASVLLFCAPSILLRIASSRGLPRGFADEPGLYIPPIVNGIANPNPAGRPPGLGLFPAAVEPLTSTSAVVGLKLGILRAALLNSFLWRLVSCISLDFLICAELLLCGLNLRLGMILNS